MAAYIVFIKEREHDAAAMQEYGPAAAASLAGSGAKPLVAYGELQTIEGPEAQGCVILEFPTVEDARAWYDSDAYQAARKIRFQGGDYRGIIVKGI